MNQPKRALIAGQDDSYLAEFLLGKRYEVHGMNRRASMFNTQRIDHIYEDPHVEHQRLVQQYGDLTDLSNLTRILTQVQPDEFYNLGAKPRGGQLRGAGVHRRCRRHRRAPPG